jgi:hypothetical protein
MQLDDPFRLMGELHAIESVGGLFGKVPGFVPAWTTVTDVLALEAAYAMSPE